jgi:NADPH-dependent curcumin reductase CurA
VQIDEIMRGSAIGVVKASKSAKFPVGSYAIANIGWTELAIANEKTLENIEVPKNGKVTDALGVLGMYLLSHCI